MLQKLVGAEGNLEAVGQAVGETLGLQASSLAVTIAFDHLVEPCSLLPTDSLHCVWLSCRALLLAQAVQLMILLHALALQHAVPC